jgi:hypothetical protein
VVILATSPQKSPTKFIMDSYWDLYVAYVAKCIKENKEQDIDPEHYEMEWNHFLPQCIFGDQPAGQYLLLRQHAIATALQTLAFKKNCMTGMMKKYLPSDLLELAWPYYGLASSKRMSGLLVGDRNPNFGKTGESHYLYGVKRPEHSRIMSGEGNPNFGKTWTDSEETRRKKSETQKGVPKSAEHRQKVIDAKTGIKRSEEAKEKQSKSMRGRKHWVNKAGEIKLQLESPGPEWQNGRKFKQTEVTQ